MATVNKIVRCVFNADLRCSHDGLTLIAKELKLDVDDLKPGEVIVFVNAKRTHIKLYGSMNVLVHYKNKDGRKIEMKTLALIPKFFNGREFQYDKALRQVLTEGGLK